MKIGFFSSLLASALSLNTASSLEVGDTICVQGYIMDYWCIDNVVMLDNPKLKTLESPGEHTAHCLLDVGVCLDSPFEVLTDPVASGGLYTRGYRLTDDCCYERS